VGVSVCGVNNVPIWGGFRVAEVVDTWFLNSDDVEVFCCDGSTEDAVLGDIRFI